MVPQSQGWERIQIWGWEKVIALGIGVPQACPDLSSFELHCSPAPYIPSPVPDLPEPPPWSPTPGREALGTRNPARAKDQERLNHFRCGVGSL